MTEVDDLERLRQGTSRTDETHILFTEWIKKFGAKFEETFVDTSLPSKLTHVRDNIYKNDAQDFFEISENGFTLIIDPHKKYK